MHYNDSWPHLEWNRCRKDRQCEGNAPALTDFENFDNVGPGINMLTDDIVKLFGDKAVVSITSRNRYYRVSFIQQNPYLKHAFGDLAEYILEGNFNWYRLLFQPAPPIKQLMKRVEFMDDYISVHIRTGVDVDEAKTGRFLYWSSHEEETVENALRCMENVAKNVTNIFLASDSVKTKELFKKKAHERGYEVHLLEKRTLHSDKFRGAVRNEPWDAVCEGFLTVFSDLFMLSGGKTLIKTGSHFSRLAWFLSKGQRAFELQPDGECKVLKKTL